MSFGLWPLQLSPDSAGTGVDPATFWVILSTLCGTIATLGGLLYRGERDRRIAAEAKLEKFQEVAPELADHLRYLVDREEERLSAGSNMPWPTTRRPRRIAPPPTRRRSR